MPLIFEIDYFNSVSYNHPVEKELTINTHFQFIVSYFQSLLLSTTAGVVHFQRPHVMPYEYIASCKSHLVLLFSDILLLPTPVTTRLCLPETYARGITSKMASPMELIGTTCQVR